MKSKLPDRKKPCNFRHSLVPLAWCASVGAALGAVPHPAGPLLAAGTSAVAPAEITVQGTVTDTKGEGLPGVNVILKGTSKGATTDAQGRFRLSVPDQGSVLVFSFVGFTSQEVAVTNSEALNIKLEAQDKSLDEVVVVGYGTQSRALVTGAVGQVTSQELVRTPAVAATTAMVGRIPGVTGRQADARPGNGTSIQIRNMGDPLYVIDGIQSDVGAFNNLGLNDIETVSVLKDASAAIYGLRASNGVVLVTTKRGKLGKPVININGYYGIQNFTAYPQPANAYQHLRAQVESEQNQAQQDHRAIRTVIDPIAGPLIADTLERWRQGVGSRYQSYDYNKFIFRPNVPQLYGNASVSGATDNVSYYLSGSYLDQKALIEDYFFRRYNIQANLEAKVTPRFRVGTQISARLERRHTVGVPGTDDYFNPLLSVFSMWPTEAPYANGNPDYVNQTHNVNVNPGTYRESITGYNDDDWRSGKANLYGQYDFGFGLTARATGSYTYTTNTFNGFEYTYNAYNYNPTTKTYFTQPGWGNQNPWRQQVRRAIIERFGQLQLNYNKQLRDHGLALTAAYERFDSDDRGLTIHTVPPNNTVPTQLFANQDYLNDYITEIARAGYVGRFGYNYKQKYLAEILGRYDGSYLFAPGSRYGFFPAATVGYRISEEAFLKNSAVGRVLTELKLRGSYGLTGSDPNGLNPYSYYQGYDFGSGASVLNGNYTIGVRPRGLPITSLSWVKNKTANIGVDFGLFGGKLAGTFDIFRRRRTGLPAADNTVVLPQEVGYSLNQQNLNSDETKGLEGGLTYSGATSRGLTYSVGAHATLARRFDRYYGQRFGNSWQRYRDGYEDRWGDVGWGYHVIGQFQSEQQIADYKVDNDGQGNRSQLPGDYMYEDVNGDGIINGYDQRPIGYIQGGQPLVTYALNTSFGYKGFTLNIDVVGAGMQTFQRAYELLVPFQNNGTSPNYIFEDRWHRADPYNADSPWVPGKYPSIRRNGGGNNFANNDYLIRTVRYLRLRNIELGYNLPKAWLSKVSLQGVRVYVNATNLVTFSTLRDVNVDPEVASGNGLQYPVQRLINTGFSVNF
jgi:TonB-linked SusC/RagA family outer membrane protein